MSNTHNLVRQARKDLVAAILRPSLTAKKDRTMEGQYKRVGPGEDGRIRTVLSPVVTETGRLASGESFVDPASTNLQNLSKKESYKDQLYRVRDCFIADPGMVLIASDLDKAEAVIVGFESENWDFYEDLINQVDIHTRVAAWAYHEGNEKAVSKPERQRCKNVLYLSFYRGGVSRMTKTINADATSRADRLTEAETQVVYDVIMDWLNLEAWWDRVWSELMDPDMYGGERWLENCLGFRRMFYHPTDHKRWNEAVNFPPQSTVAGLIDRALIESHEWEVPGEFELLLQVHDELLWQVDKTQVSKYAPRILELMQHPFEARGRSVYIPASIEVGYRWDGFRGVADEPLDPENTLKRMERYVIHPR